MHNLTAYLQPTATINYEHPSVAALAKLLADSTPLKTAKGCFEWVRDEIKHSVDYQLNPVTCSASEVLDAGTGFCYAKSHLLAALLRANHIPAGLCYQRLHQAESLYCLHGLNAVYLPDYGWYRIDARGNKALVDAQFAPPIEQLAFKLEVPGEADLPDIYAEPLPVVTTALHTYHTWHALMANLPDFDPLL